MHLDAWQYKTNVSHFIFRQHLWKGQVTVSAIVQLQVELRAAMAAGIQRVISYFSFITFSDRYFVTPWKKKKELVLLVEFWKLTSCPHTYDVM